MMTEGLKKIKEALAKMPPEMKDCIKEKMGADKLGKIEKGEDVEIGPEIEGIIQGCTGNIEGMMENKMEQAMEQVPPEMRGCVQEKLGNIAEKIKSGEVKESDIPGLIQECVSSMIPKDIPIPSGIPSQEDIEALKGLQKEYEKMIPEGMPKDIPQNIPDIPKNIPTPPAEMPQIPTSIPQMTGAPEAQGPSCDQFIAVPDCSFVPSSVQSICKQCKGQ